MRATALAALFLACVVYGIHWHMQRMVWAWVTLVTFVVGEGGQ